MEGSTSTNAHRAKDIQFNYKLEVRSTDLYFRPNFPATGPADQDLAIATNSEVPSLLSVAGELTAEENNLIHYHKIESEEKIFVGRPGEEVFFGTYLNEAVVEKQPKLLEYMMKARKSLLKKDENGQSEFETQIKGRNITKNSADQRRMYTLGFVITPQKDVGVKAIPTKLLNYPEGSGEVTNLLGKIAAIALESVVPREELKLVNRQFDADAPLTIGDKSHKYICKQPKLLCQYIY